jgi:hypothetical protein
MAELLSRSETLQALRISEWSLRRLIEAGRLQPVYTTPGRGKTMFRAADVRALIDGTPPAPSAQSPDHSVADAHRRRPAWSIP